MVFGNFYDSAWLQHHDQGWTESLCNFYRADEAAFRAFVDRFTAEASPATFDIPKSPAEIEEVESLIRQKLEELKTD